MLIIKDWLLKDIVKMNIDSNQKSRVLIVWEQGEDHGALSLSKLILATFELFSLQCCNFHLEMLD